MRMHLTDCQLDPLSSSPANPRSVSWVIKPHTITLKKTKTGSLGIKINTISQNTAKGVRYITLISSVKPECSVQDRTILAENDIIVAVDGRSIRETSPEAVQSIFRSHKNPTITLGICTAVVPTTVTASPNIDGQQQPDNFGNILQRALSGDSGHYSSPASGGVNGTFLYPNNDSNSVVKRPLSHSTNSTDSSQSEAASLYSSPSVRGSPETVHAQSGTFLSVQTIQNSSFENNNLNDSESSYNLSLNDKRSSGNSSDSATANIKGHASITSNSSNEMAFDGLHSMSNRSVPKCVSKVTPQARGVRSSESLWLTEQILKYPEKVLWDSNTVAVTLQRVPKQTPHGITLVSKPCKNHEDVYTLVEHVKKGSPAEGKLFAGDLILSVNGKPIHGVQEALGLPKLLEELHTVKFIIQQPVDMKEFRREDRSSGDKSSKQGNYTPSSPQFTHTSSPNVEPFSNCTYGYLDQSPANTTKVDRCICSSPRSGASGMNRSLPVCTGSSQASSLMHRSVSTSAPIFDMFSLAKLNSSMDEPAKFPTMKLFVVGSHATQMVKMLLPSSGKILEAGSKYKFIQLSCFVCEDSDGLTDDKSLNESDMLSRVLSQCIDGQISVCEDDIHVQLDLMNTQTDPGHLSRCFSRMTSRSSNANNSVVNLEIHVFLDEQFFSQCSLTMFSKNSIFFVTFDGSKVLENTSEMSRIGNLVHVIRTNAGIDSPLCLYGFLELDTSDTTSKKADELKALFYTDHGHQILRYPNVSMPQFITQSDEFVHLECHEIRSFLGQLALQQEFLIGQLHLATLSIMAWVIELRRQGIVAMTMAELKDGITSLVSDISTPKLTKLIQELVTSGTILTSGGVDQPHYTVLIQPIYLVQCVSIILSELEKTVPKNSPRETTNVLKTYPTSVTKNMLQKAFQAVDCAELKFKDFVQLCVNFNIIYKVWQAPDLYYLTYFLPETETKSVDQDLNPFVLFLKLGKCISAAVFLTFLNTLTRCCKPKRLLFHGINNGEMLLCDWTIKMEHFWKEDLIKFSLKSEKSNLPHSPPSGLLQCVLDTSRRCLPTQDFQICVPCPVCEECDTDKRRKLHLIDILQSEPIYCGNSRVDDQKPVKTWLAGVSLKNISVKTGCHGDKPPDRDPPSSSKKKQYDWSTKLLHLPYSVLNQIFLQLLVPHAQGNDWTGFAGYIGKTTNEVEIYRLQRNPAEELIMDWARKTSASVQDFVNILSSEAMERVDLIDMLTEKLNLRSTFNKSQVL